MPQTGQATLLSLKNIYRLLTKEDYPLPSAAVISRAKRRGLTTAAFWQQLLAEELAVTEQGQKLWQVEEGRSRYLSDLFNRNRPGPFYAAYFEAVAAQLNEALLGRLTASLQRFLQDSAYDSQALMTRLDAFLPLIYQHDAAVPPAVHTYLRTLVWHAPEYRMDGDSSSLYDAFLLAQLSLHAFFGERMDTPALGRLRRDQGMMIAQLKSALRPPGQQPAWPTLLTSQACELCSSPLPARDFVGRGQELSHLVSHLSTGGKILVSDMAGIGKSELVRQALRHLLRSGVYAQVAYVAYRNGLQESFLRSFIGLSGTSPEASFDECLHRLSAGGRSLLLVDHMNTPPHEDQALLALAGLGCDVVLTSRLAGLDGFSTLPLQGLDTADAVRVFSTAYGQALSGVEQQQLEHLIKAHLAGHPLMCQMLGSLARSRHLRFADLYEGLRDHGLQGSYTHQAQAVKLEETLRQLFYINSLPDHLQRLLHLFALLPQGQYSFAQLHELMADITTDRATLADWLQTLAYLGWLSNAGGHYAMHPLVIEALREPLPEMSDFPQFFALLESRVRTDKYREWPYVNLAAHALTRVHINQKVGKKLMVSTVTLLCEQGLLATAQRLLYKQGQALCDDPLLGSADYCYQYHALCLFLLRNQGQFEGAQAHIDAIIRLLPKAQEVPLRPYGLGHALFFASNLSLQTQHDALLALLAQGDWRSGREAAEHCYMMAEYHTYLTRESAQVIHWAQQGLQELAKVGQADVMQAANLRHALALGYAYSGQPEQALAQFDRFTHTYQRWMGNTETLSFSVLDNSLGIAYYQQGEYDQALPHFVRALERVRRATTQDSHLVQSYLGNISNVYLHKQEYAKAIDYGQEALAMHQRLNPIDNLQTSLLINNLGCIHRDSGQHDTALGLLSRARDIACALAGPDSIHCAEPEFNLGRTHLLLGDKVRAATHLRRALSVFETGYGQEHPRTLMAQGILAEALG